MAGRARARVPRSLAWALAASLCAHGVLLWPSAPRTVRPLLHASLRPGPVSQAGSGAPGQAEVQPADSPRAPGQAPAPATPKLPQRSKPVREPRPSPASGSAALAVTAATLEPAVQVDGESLRSYRLSLALNARRFHAYPPQALEQGHTGTAEVRIAVARNGLLGHVDLLRSSGHDLLDRQARDMLARAAQATALPEALRGQTFVVDLPVEFSLPAR